MDATWPNLGRFWRPTWVPKASQDEAKKEKKREANKNRFRIGLGAKKGTEGKSGRVSYKAGGGGKGRLKFPRSFKISPRETQGFRRALQAARKTRPEAFRGPESIFSIVLNDNDFLKNIFVEHSPEAIKKIQEVAKINVSDPPSF